MGKLGAISSLQPGKQKRNKSQEVGGWGFMV